MRGNQGKCDDYINKKEVQEYRGREIKSNRVHGPSMHAQCTETQLYTYLRTNDWSFIFIELLLFPRKTQSRKNQDNMAEILNNAPP